MPRVLLFWILPALAAGCTPTETGNPPFTTDVGYDDRRPMGVSPDPVIEEAWLVLDGLAFVPDGDCPASDPEPQLVGPTVVELVSGGYGSPVELREGTYCGLRITFAPGVAEIMPGVPAAVLSSGMVLAGAASDGTPVNVAFTPDPVSLDAPTAFPMDPMQQPVRLAIDFTLLFAGVAPATLEVTDGTILIDGAHNTAALATLRAQLAGSMLLARDANDNGMLDEAEASMPLAP